MAALPALLTLERVTATYNGTTLPSSFIDNISLAAVPEPASWALMMIGVGALGASLRSRRKMAIA